MDTQKNHSFGFAMPNLPSPKKEDLDIRIGDRPIEEIEGLEIKPRVDLATDVENFLRHLPAHKAELSITHNEHLAYYQTVAQWAEENEMVQWCSEDSKARAIEANDFWQLFWNPDTPVGSYSIAANSLVELLQTVEESHDDAGQP